MCHSVQFTPSCHSVRDRMCRRVWSSELLKLILLFIVVVQSFTVYSETTKLTVCEWKGYIMPWEVEFKASYEVGGQTNILHERSFFKKILVASFVQNI